jgi:hypothetical protein
MNKHISKSLQWLLRHAITVFSCVTIIVLSMGAVAYSSTSTTIGENISTNGTLTVLSNSNLAATTISGGDLTVDTDTLYVDNDNNRVGIGTTNPSSLLYVNGDTTINGNLAGTLYADTLNYNFFNVAMWGDSYTQSIPTILSLTLTDKSVYVYGVGGETSTQIASRMIAASNTHDYITIIWAGRNNHDAPTTVEADIANMVAALGSNTNFLILSVLNGEVADEYIGESSYNNIIAINDYLEATYPNNYYDIRSYLVSQYDPAAPQDVIDFGHDIVPDSLRSNTIHPNTTGYQLVADQIQTFINSNFIPTTDKPLSYIDIPTIFINPPPLGQITLLSGRKIIMNGEILFQASTTLGNYFFGSAGNLTATGSNNLAVGYDALNRISTGSNNTAMGTNALTLTFTGDNNTAMGYNALNRNTNSNNTAMGYNALTFNTAGASNVAMGLSSLSQNTSGSYNTAIGTYTLSYNTTSVNNTAVGNNVLNKTTGSNNTAVGAASLTSNTTGSYNTAVGAASFNKNTGNNNTALGYYAGFNATTGSSNVFLGYYAGAYETGSDAFYINNQNRTNTAGDKSNALMYGTFADTAADQLLTINAKVGIGTTTPATKLDVDGIIKTQPRSTATCDTLSEGGIYFDSDDNHFYGCNGSTWIRLDYNP